MKDRSDLVAQLVAATTPDQVAAILDQADAAAAGRPKYHVPGPYEIALTMAAALASSGRFETPGAAMAAAWMAVPEFFQARDTYIRDLAPIMFAMGAPTEGEADGGAAETH